jgi:hypothetical protein
MNSAELAHRLLLTSEGEPFYLVACLWSAVLVVAWLASHSRGAQTPTVAAPRPGRLTLRIGENVLVILSAAAVAAFAGACVVYLRTEFFHDHTEPAAMVLSWKFALGQPIYHDPDSAARYSLLYGPLVFAANALGMGLLGPSLLSAKLAGAVAGVGGLLILFFSLRGAFGWRRGLIGAGYAALCGLAFEDTLFNPRPDAQLFFWGCLGVAAASSRAGLPAALGVGLAAGAAVGCKAHAWLYFVPLLALLLRRHGRGRLAAALLAAVVLAALPFALFRQVSWANYRYWLMAAAQHGFSWDLLVGNLRWAAVLAAPVLVAILFRAFTLGRKGVGLSAPGRVLAFVGAAAMAAVCVLGAKRAAGPHHLLPFLPMLAYAACEMWEPTDQAGLRAAAANGLPASCPRWLGPALVAALLAALLPGVASRARRMTTGLLRADKTGRELSEEVASVLARHPYVSIHMGCAGNRTYPLTWVRPLLEFAGRPVQLDPVALMDMAGSRLPLPAATLELVARGRSDLWLVPRGEPPLSLLHDYRGPPGEPVFPAEFREAFLSNLEPVERTRFFEVWAPSPSGRKPITQ